MKIPLLFIAITWACGACSLAQESRSVDVLPLVKPGSHVLQGDWQADDSGLKANVRSGRGLCVIPYELRGAYELTCEFTRQNGTNVVGIILPLNKSQVLLELSGWDGQAHGLARIDGASSRSEANPTSVRPGTLANGERQRVVVRVLPEEDKLAIQTTLNGKELFSWEGKYDQAQPNVAIQIDSNSRPALFVAQSDTVFHAVSIRHSDGAGEPVDVDFARVPPGDASRPSLPSAALSIEPGDVNLAQVNWSEKRGDIEVAKFQGEDVLRTQGEDDTVAFLPGVEMRDGTIEVEIAADIFSGIAFRGADTDNYDLIYFRPQNSGTAKHKNTVQYVSKGVDGADWRSLRENFPGKYEAGAVMKVNRWFRVRIELEGDTARTYVNDSDEPVLTVEKLLSERASGKIGVWGWNSHFRNFSFQPVTTELENRK